MRRSYRTGVIAAPGCGTARCRRPIVRDGSAARTYLARFLPPALEPAVEEALVAFKQRRTEEGGAARR
jgi:hypothetical protein